MLPALPYILWEQAQHKSSLRLSVFCTAAPAEEHGLLTTTSSICISLHSSRKQVLESLENSHGMLDESGENNPFFCIGAHNMFVLPISNPVPDTAVLALSAALPSFEMIAVSTYHAQHINPEESAALVSQSGALICQELSQAAEGRYLFSPPHLLPFSLTHWVLAREGLNRTLF